MFLIICLKVNVLVVNVGKMYDRSDFNLDNFVYYNKFNESCCVDFPFFYIVMLNLFVCPLILLWSAVEVKIAFKCLRNEMNI